MQNGNQCSFTINYWTQAKGVPKMEKKSSLGGLTDCATETGCCIGAEHFDQILEWLLEEKVQCVPIGGQGDGVIVP